MQQHEGCPAARKVADVQAAAIALNSMFGEGQEVRPLGIRHDLAPFARGSHSVGMSCSSSGGAVSAKRNLNIRTTVWARHSSPACKEGKGSSRSQHPAARYHTSDLLQSRAPQVLWRILAVERSPKIAPVVSAVRGIAIIRDRLIFGNSRAQGLRGQKQQETLMAQGFLTCLIILDFCTAGNVCNGSIPSLRSPDRSGAPSVRFEPLAKMQGQRARHGTKFSPLPFKSSVALSGAC